MTCKFKVGDKVKVIKDVGDFDVGDIFVIEHISGPHKLPGEYCLFPPDKNGIWADSVELAKVDNWRRRLTKNDL